MRWNPWYLRSMAREKVVVLRSARLEIPGLDFTFRHFSGNSRMTRPVPGTVVIAVHGPSSTNSQSIRDIFSTFTTGWSSDAHLWLDHGFMASLTPNAVSPVTPAA